MTTAPMTQQTIEELSINTIRTLSLDAVQAANSGHPGLPLGAAPMAYVLWTKFLRHNPKNPKWFNRDRFVLSAGHGSMLLYSLLHLTGYDSMPMEEIKNFRQWQSKTPGHPENHITAGVEVTTGPLGQGFANGIGMALASKHFAAVFNREGFDVVDNYVYAICSDGDLMEGVSYEAASIAGHLKLGNIIYLFDDNEITIDGGTNLTFTEDRTKRFEACGWHVQMVEDGNDLQAIENAIRAAQNVTDKPSLIRVKTIIGFGMPNQGTSDAHSDAIGDDGVAETKRNLGWDEDKKFYVPDEVYAHFQASADKGAEAEKDWNELIESYAEKFADEAKSFKLIMNDELPADWEDALPKFEGVASKATRVYSGEVINALAEKIPNLLGGSADLAVSNKTDIKTSKPFQSETFEGRNIYYGIREHAMGSLMNGMSLYGGTIPFGGTFLTFSDYMRPSIRLAALSELQVIYVFTHDSIGLGEDGPTHQSVEHITALRAIPHLTVIRPADAHEVREAYRIAIKNQKSPTALALSRQNVAVIDRENFASAEGTQKGGYILAEASNNEPQIIIVATGSEVGLAINTREQLESENIPTRVVSMPCRKLFYEQSKAYQAEVLPENITARLVIEAGVRMGWEGIIGKDGDAITVDKFGASAPAEKVFDEYGFNLENALNKAKSLLFS